jgi:hypothetical protein
VAPIDDANSQRFYHGTKVDLKSGDLIEPGYNSNFGRRKKAAYVYLTATLDAATWGAELALGDSPGKIYTVEPTGPYEDDPNLTRSTRLVRATHRKAPRTWHSSHRCRRAGRFHLRRSSVPCAPHGSG